MLKIQIHFQVIYITNNTDCCQPTTFSLNQRTITMTILKRNVDLGKKGNENEWIELFFFLNNKIGYKLN